MEGVMMKNLDRYAVAVRKPDHEIEVMTDEYKSLGSRYAVLGLPIIRGVVNFGESLYIGLKTLSYSSSFYEEEDYEPGKVEQFFTKIFVDKLESVNGNHNDHFCYIGAWDFYGTSIFSYESDERISAILQYTYPD